MRSPGDTTNGRVRDDQVERLAGHRLEQRALPQVPLLTGQRRGRRGHPQRPRADVRGHHRPGVRGQMQRLHAAAGPDVERPLGRPPDDRLRERQRGRADAEDVIAGQRAGPHVAAEVRDDPPGLGAVGIAVRTHLQPGAHRAGAAREQGSGRLEIQRVQRRAGGALVHLVAEQEQPDEVGEPVVGRQHARDAGEVASLVRRPSDQPEQFVHAVDGEVRQREPQRVERGGFEQRCGHVAILSILVTVSH